jgi:hypothetical protein
VSKRHTIQLKLAPIHELNEDIGFRILPLIEHCSRDLRAVKIKSSNEEGPREIIFGSAYLPYDDVEPPPTRELERLVA